MVEVSSDLSTAGRGRPALHAGLGADSFGLGVDSFGQGWIHRDIKS